MQFSKMALLSLTMGLVAPWSVLQGMAAYVRETMPRKCRLPPRYGWCKESFQNFYYDFKSSMCKTFIYSGCRGNGNNFVTLLDCFLECGKFGLLIPLKNVLGDIQWNQGSASSTVFSSEPGDPFHFSPASWLIAGPKHLRDANLVEGKAGAKNKLLAIILIPGTRGADHSLMVVVEAMRTIFRLTILVLGSVNHLVPSSALSCPHQASFQEWNGIFATERAKLL
ncbi:Kunitz-type serine protease inhibitor mulgin-2 [Varanus komodoensis]|nr:Kunitz-type serine protease inhibitor mulgin-2 [Varanus komodoensis]